MPITRHSEDMYTITQFNVPGAVVTFSNPREVNDSVCAKISYKGVKDGHNIRLWGRDNSLPQFREQLLMENNIAGPLLQTKRDINYGTGIFAYKKKDVSDGGKINIEEVPLPDAAKEFFDKVDIDDYLLCAFKNYFFHSTVFTEFVRNLEGAIDSIKIQECKYTRLGEQNANGVIDTAYISGAWATQKYANDGMTEFEKDIFQVPMYNKDPSVKQNKFMLHTGDSMFNDGYYNTPVWWGSRAWIELANAIPIFHQANLRNGYTIRFHIQIPKGYFYISPQADGVEALKKAKDNEAQRLSAFMKDVNDILAGVHNTGRALFTEYDIQVAMGKEYPGIKIDPINVDIKDEALLALFDKSNTANISAQGIHPTLANVETQGKLSSGSEMRNAFIMYLATKTPIPRMNVLKPINLVKKINKWDPEIFFGFGDTEITTLDENPTGMNKDAAVVPDNKAA